MLEEDADSSLQDSNAHAIALLRKDMKSWLQTTISKYPSLHVRALCGHFLKEDSESDDKGTNDYRDTRLSIAECQEIVRLRNTGISWQGIVNLKYPGWRRSQLRTQFAAAIDRGRQSPVKNRERGRKRSTFSCTAADRLEVARLRKEGSTWAAIKNLMFPEWTIRTVQRNLRTDGRRTQDESFSPEKV